MLTWRCEICGRTRPDERISVAKHDITPPTLPKGTVERNIKYCNDSKRCSYEAHYPVKGVSDGRQDCTSDLSS